MLARSASSARSVRVRKLLAIDGPSTSQRTAFPPTAAATAAIQTPGPKTTLNTTANTMPRHRTSPIGNSLTNRASLATLPAACTPLVDGQPLVGRKPDDAVNDKPIALPVAWVKTWTGNAGNTARVFHTTMGSAEDYQSAGLRRLTVNADYWCLAMEEKIDPQSKVDIVGDYKPLHSGFDDAKLKVVLRKPSDYK